MARSQRASNVLERFNRQGAAERQGSSIIGFRQFGVFGALAVDRSGSMVRG
jgi:hypothetical protein